MSCRFLSVWITWSIPSVTWFYDYSWMRVNASVQMNSKQKPEILIEVTVGTHQEEYSNKRPTMPTYSNAHTKVKKWIFHFKFRENWLEIDIISNQFWSSSIRDTQNRLLYNQVKHTQNPDIQPSHFEISLL